MSHSSALISASDLATLVAAHTVKIVDATYGQPPASIGIGNAVDFDIDLIANQAAPLPHTIPSAAEFAQAVGALGIGNNDHVVVYDQTGMAFAASRVWWMFRLFGHKHVQVLDGGLPAWQAAGYVLTPKKGPATQAAYAASFRPELFKQQQDMQKNIDTADFAVIDARDPRRFGGDIPEPRPGMASGHIPGARNVFFGSLINPDNGHLLPPERLQTAFSESGADLGKPVACSCGSGVTAGILALALHEIGHTDAAIYGGSWAEWATTPGASVAKGKE